MAQLRPYTTPLIVLLASLATLASLSMDIFLPSLPGIAQTFEATPVQVQLAIYSYLFGSAVGIVIYGPIADRYGRRPVLISAIAIFCVANAVCMYAPSIEVLIAARALQALGPSCTSVLTRAIVRDMYEGREMSRQMSLLSSMAAVGPLIAPLIGGAMQTYFGWRPSFGLLLVFGVLALFGAWFLLPETLRARSREGLSVPALLRNYRAFLQNGSYVAHISILSVTYLGLMIWLSNAPFVLQSHYGLSPFAFSVMLVIGSAGLIMGTSMAARLVMRLGVDRCIGIGSVIMAIGGLAMLTVVLTDVLPAIALVLTMTLYMIGYGFVGPQGQAGALAPFRDRAGAASSFTGFSQQAAGALLGVIVGRTFGVSALTLAILMAGFGIASCVLWIATRRVRLAAAEELLH